MTSAGFESTGSSRHCRVQDGAPSAHDHGVDSGAEDRTGRGDDYGSRGTGRERGIADACPSDLRIKTRGH